jgi:hypothetical protein
MTFHRKGIIHPGVASDTGGVLGGGYLVRIDGFLTLTYREADHSLKVGTEPLLKGAGRLVFLSGVKSWAQPHEHEVLTSEQVYKIRENIIASLKFLPKKYIPDWLPNSWSQPIG